MSQVPQKAIIVSHTHWDREWYLPLHRFRVDFARMLRQVLDLLEEDGPFRHFLLDGQTLVLEDHLATHPEDAVRILALAEAGKLSLGPWYVLPDEFLVSGEATVRNLQIGHKLAQRLGGVQKAGYMPDSFGHLAQMPQILRRAGIDSFIFTRGNGDEIDEMGWEFHWRAPDGSEVLALNQCEGYCNAGGLGHEELWHAHTKREVRPARAVERIGEIFSKMAMRSGSETALISNGCDHFPPQRDFGKVLKALRESYPETEFIHAGLPDLLTALRSEPYERPSFEGELLGGRLHLILSGVWSARMPLKQRNDACQTLLSSVLEPLEASSAILRARRPASGLLGYAWEKLLENHPHDSICGCSTDEVHREMLTRFDQVDQTARAILNESLDEMLPLFGTRSEDDRETAILVANPLPEAQSPVVERLVVLQPFGYDIDKLALFDEEGRTLPFQILERWTVERFWGVDYRAELFTEDQLEKFRIYREQFGDRILKDESESGEHDTFLHILFRAENLHPAGHRLFFLREVETAAVGVDDPVHVDRHEMENSNLHVRLHPNGCLDLVDKHSNRRFEGLNLLEDVADIGDEYDFGTLAGDVSITSANLVGEITREIDGPLRGRLQWRGTLRLPRSLTLDRKRRSDDLVDCPVVLSLSLDAGSSRLDLELDFDNLAEDHRLRAAFPTKIVSDEIVSDGQFMLNRRKLDLPRGENWAQAPTGTFPQQEFSWIADDAGGLAVFAKGLPEVAALRDDEGRVSLELTLLRSVGWLSRDDFADRRFANAGPTLATPEAQCLGRHRFQFALMPFQGDGVVAGVKAESARWRTPLPARQGVASLAVPGTPGLIWGLSHRAALSSLRLHPDRGSLLLRIYNLTGEDIEENLQLGFDAAEVWRCDLLEERESKIEFVRTTEIELALKRFEILTIEIKPLQSS